MFTLLAKIEKILKLSRFNPLPNNKISERSILKAFADDKIDVTEKLKFVLRGVENIMGKGENAVFKRLLSQGR